MHNMVQSAAFILPSTTASGLLVSLLLRHDHQQLLNQQISTTYNKQTSHH